MNGQIETRMALIPSERIYEVLFEYLSDDEANRIEASRRPLAFQSYGGYKSTHVAQDIPLRRFRSRSDGVYVPLAPIVKARYYRKPGEDDRPQLGGLKISVAANLGHNDDMTREAQLLGYADSSGIVMARYAIRADVLASFDEHARITDQLEALIRSPGQELVEIAFAERPVAE